MRNQALAEGLLTCVADAGLGVTWLVATAIALVFGCDLRNRRAPFLISTLCVGVVTFLIWLELLVINGWTVKHLSQWALGNELSPRFMRSHIQLSLFKLILSAPVSVFLWLFANLALEEKLDLKPRVLRYSRRILFALLCVEIAGFLLWYFAWRVPTFGGRLELAHHVSLLPSHEWGTTLSRVMPQVKSRCG